MAGFYKTVYYGTNNKINLPKPRPLPGSQIAVPYVFLSDGAFALCTNIMKPFPGDHAFGSMQRTFNYTLSKSRVVVENAFGILSSRFRVFRRPFALKPNKVCTITMSFTTQFLNEEQFVEPSIQLSRHH